MSKQYFSSRLIAKSEKCLESADRGALKRPAGGVPKIDEALTDLTRDHAFRFPNLPARPTESGVIGKSAGVVKRPPASIPRLTDTGNETGTKITAEAVCSSREDGLNSSRS
jgi:hypothetical protein